MQQRLLVMNGQRIVQANQGETWANRKVDKAGSLKPGIYNLYMAKEANKSSSYSGIIVYTENNKIYQQLGKKFIMHSCSDFDIIPEIGSAKNISYDKNGKAIVTQAIQTKTKGRSI